jgi:hypothetical protein
MDERALRDAALEYHRFPTAGKISVAPTKGLTNQHDLSLAYSPGVAYACLAIRDNPQEASAPTSRSNLVAPLRERLERLADRRGDLVVTDLARCARTRLVVEAVHPMLGEPLMPPSSKARGNVNDLSLRTLALVDASVQR